MLVLLAVSILLYRGERLLEGIVPFAALLAVMAIGLVILEKREHYAHELSSKFGKLWVFAEIVLFTMVGAQVDVNVAWKCGLSGAVLIVLVELTRFRGYPILGEKGVHDGKDTFRLSTGVSPPHGRAGQVRPLALGAGPGVRALRAGHS